MLLVSINSAGLSRLREATGLEPSHWHSACREASRVRRCFKRMHACESYERSRSTGHTRTHENAAHAARDVRPRETSVRPGESHAFRARRRQYAPDHADRSREVALLSTALVTPARHDDRRLAADLAD